MPLHNLGRCKPESPSVFLSGYDTRYIRKSRNVYCQIAFLLVSVPQPRFPRYKFNAASDTRVSSTPSEFIGKRNDFSLTVLPQSLADNGSYVLAPDFLSGRPLQKHNGKGLISCVK